MGYRAKALELLAQAEIAKDADTRGNFESLAAAFLRLAMQVERNEGVVIDFVLPPSRLEDFPDRPPCVSAFEVSSYRTVSDSEPVVEQCPLTNRLSAMFGPCSSISVRVYC